jgi:hypothetical protein
MPLLPCVVIKSQSCPTGYMISGFRSWDYGWMVLTEDDIGKCVMERRGGKPLKHFSKSWKNSCYYSYHCFEYGASTRFRTTST